MVFPLLKLQFLNIPKTSFLNVTAAASLVAPFPLNCQTLSFALQLSLPLVAIDYLRFGSSFSYEYSLFVVGTSHPGQGIYKKVTQRINNKIFFQQNKKVKFQHKKHAAMFSIL